MEVVEVLKASVEVVKGLDQITSSDLTFAKEAIHLTAAVGEAITPFIPLIGLAAAIIKEIVVTYQKAQHNKKICNSILDRARIAEFAIDQLIRRRNDYGKNLKSKSWTKAFDRFVTVLDKIKNFAKETTQLHGIMKFVNARKIEDRFEVLMDEYDIVMKDLNFTIIINNEQQRQIDHESVKHDLYETQEFLKKIHVDTKENNIKLALIMEEVKDMKSMMDRPKIVEAKRIDASELINPQVGKENDTRGSSIKRKIYMNGIEVACKNIKIPNKNTDADDYKRTQRHLNILIKASSQSPNIIQFYGLSEINKYQVMVLEWAQLGDLRGLYLSKSTKIPFDLKLNYALQICRGIAYLSALDVLHHDLRCKNVVVTENHVAKLTNFNYSRGINFSTSTIADQFDCFRWLAPEKLKNIDYSYDYKCEIFSFGMLLWELAFEKLPYEGMEFDKGSAHVKQGKREEIRFDLASPEIADIQKQYEKIIREAWKQDPDTRISISKLLIELDTLANSFVKPGHSPSLQPQKKAVVNSNNGDDYEFPEYTYEFNLDLLDEALEPLIPISEGEIAHKSKDFEKAWKCFEAQAENQNSYGKLWKAIYLWDGIFVERDKFTALTLFKEAADDGNSESQFRYAGCLVDKEIKSRIKNTWEFVKYLQMAADNGFASAQYQIGESYLNGKLDYKQDKELAILWYKRAAIQKERRAINKLKELNVEMD